MTVKVQDYGGFGDGSLGDIVISNASTQLNSYANVVAESADGKVLQIGSPSAGSFGTFAPGTEIMFHVTGCLTSESTNMGKYGFANILAMNGVQLTVDKAFPVVDLSKYVVQIVSIPHFNNLTVGCRISALAYDTTKKYGGILIAKTQKTLDLTNGMLLSEGKGLPSGSSLRPAGITLSNSDLAIRLVMNQGNGIVVGISNTLTLGANSRLGASWSGAGIGGRGGAYGSANGYNNGAAGIAGLRGYSGTGGWLESSDGEAYPRGGYSGATIFLVANSIANFDISIFSTGGECGYSACWSVYGTAYGTNGTNGTCGGAGYGGGGGGGYCGWGGGGSGGGYSEYGKVGGNNNSGSGGLAGGAGAGGGGGAGFGYIATNTALTTNTVAYALDTLLINKTGMLTANNALDCTAMTSVDGFNVTSHIPANCDGRVIFKVNSPVAGSRTYPITTQAAANDTVTIGATFTAVASGATGNQFNIGANVAATATNLAAAMNGNSTISATYTASADASGNVILTEKNAGFGNTPPAASKTGTIVIGTGTVTNSVPAWYKISGSGAATLTAVNTQAPTVDSVLAEGNTVADLQGATSVAGFVGKSIYPIIALTAPSDATDLPTMQLAVKGHSTVAQTSMTISSPQIKLASEDVELIDLQAMTAATDGATATTAVMLQQSGNWSPAMTLAQAKRQKASAIQFQATLAVATIGTGSAQLSKATATYHSNDAAVSGETAEIVSVTEDFANGMRYGRLMVKHQKLQDAGIKAYISMRDVPQTRERIPIGVGSQGQRLTLTLGVKDASGNVTPDPGVNHSTIRIFYGSQEVFDFDYNTQIAASGVTQLSQVSVTPDDGVTVFASFEYGWQPETWTQMTAGSTQKYDDTTDSTTFSYTLPDGQTGKGVSDVKIVLDKPGGHVTSEALGTATGKTQMFVLSHAAKTSSIVVSASDGSTPAWTYDYDSRILTVVGNKGATLSTAYDWVAETPIVRGFVAAWSE